MRSLLQLVLILFSCSPMMGASADSPLPPVEKVTSYLDDLYRSQHSHARLAMSIKTKHFERTLEIESWTIGEQKALMVIRKPARESGTATLRTQDGLWNYAPRADRLVRIPTSLLSESWMGSHFTNDDLVRDSSFSTDFTTEVAWQKEDGLIRLMVRLIPKPDAPVVYTKVTFTLDKDSWLPLRTDWYDGDVIVRTTKYSDVRTFSGRQLPATMTVVPSDSPSEFTSITYRSLEFAKPPKSSLFTPSGLRRAARRR